MMESRICAAADLISFFALLFLCSFCASTANNLNARHFGDSARHDQIFAYCCYTLPKNTRKVFTQPVQSPHKFMTHSSSCLLKTYKNLLVSFYDYVIRSLKNKKSSFFFFILRFV